MIFLRIKEWGIGRVGKKFEMGRAPFLENHFFKNFLDQENTKHLPFPHAWTFHLPLTILTGGNVLGILIFIHAKGKTIMCMNSG